MHAISLVYTVPSSKSWGGQKKTLVETVFWKLQLHVEHEKREFWLDLFFDNQRVRQRNLGKKQEEIN
jgi:hypothetical protein